MNEPELALRTRRIDRQERDNRRQERTNVNVVLSICLAIVLSACGAVQTTPHEAVGAGGLQPTQADKDAGLVGISPGFNLKDYRVITVDRFAVPSEGITDEADKKLTSSLPTFYQSELVRRLRESGLFDKVVNLSETSFQPGAERALKLEGTITNLSGGSRALRFWIGFGAGRSKAQAETRFVDSQSGQVVLVTADRRVAAISEALSLDYGGDSEDLLKQSFDNMARDLTRFLSRLARGEAPRAD